MNISVSQFEADVKAKRPGTIYIADGKGMGVCDFCHKIGGGPMFDCIQVYSNDDGCIRYKMQHNVHCVTFYSLSLSWSVLNRLAKSTPMR